MKLTDLKAPSLPRPAPHPRCWSLRLIMHSRQFTWVLAALSLVSGCNSAPSAVPSAPPAVPPLAVVAASAVTAAPLRPIIGLITDYGWDDAYLAQMKGEILTIAPEARLLDLIHTIDSSDVANGSFLLDEAASTFPAGTIFIAVIDPQIGSPRLPILLKTQADKFYLGPDNGIFTRVLRREGYAGAWDLNRPEYYRAGFPSSTLRGRDVFGPIAARLSQGIAPERLGTELKQSALYQLPNAEAAFISGTIACQVVEVDHFGNVILNFSRDNALADRLHDGSLVRVQVGRENHSGPMVRSYGEVEKGRLVLLFGASDLLEIAVNQGSAAKMLKLQTGAAVLLKP